MDGLDLTSQLESLKHSQQKKHITSMRISCLDDIFTGDEFRLSNTSLDSQFTKLADLCIDCLDGSSHMVLLDILENVPPTLESIQFNSISFDDMEERKPIPVYDSNIKELYLADAYDEGIDIQNWNEGIKSILGACPNLEMFEYLGNGFKCDHAGELVVDFRGLQKLKKINLYMFGVEYYTMNQEDKQGSRWKAFEKTFDQEPSIDKLHVNPLCKFNIDQCIT